MSSKHQPVIRTIVITTLPTPIYVVYSKCPYAIHPNLGSEKPAIHPSTQLLLPLLQPLLLLLQPLMLLLHLLHVAVDMQQLAFMTWSHGCST